MAQAGGKMPCHHDRVGHEQDRARQRELEHRRPRQPDVENSDDRLALPGPDFLSTATLHPCGRDSPSRPRSFAQPQVRWSIVELASAAERLDGP